MLTLQEHTSCLATYFKCLSQEKYKTSIWFSSTLWIIYSAGTILGPGRPYSITLLGS